MRGRLLLGAAAGIAGVTVLSRLAGFGRVAVSLRTLGTTCVGDTYAAMNQLPNVVYEVVAGGALAALVVPVLAAAVRDGDRAQAGRTASALLTWTVLVLTPVALLGVLLAPQLARALVGDRPCGGQAELDVGARLLRVFMPQVVLYGVGVVLAGVLQAHRRFLGPALAPLLSSVVVSGAYLLYAGRGAVGLPADLSTSQQLVLSLGTTLGVAVLASSLLVPLRRCGLVLRPTLRFPSGIAPQVRTLALAGVAGLAAQQASVVVALRLASGGTGGSVVVFQAATTLFLVPWAVLAVPVATSAFPVLAAADDDLYARSAGAALRSVLVLTLGAGALLAVVAGPVAGVLVHGSPARLADAVVAFAPGLVGYGLLALLARALYARGDGRTPAVATVTGWLVVAVADLALVGAGVDRATALGLGNTAGMSLAGGLLLVGLHRRSPAALHGALRTSLVGLAGAAAALVLGALLPALLPASVRSVGGLARLLPAAAGAGAPSVPASLLGGAVLAVAAGAVYLGVVRALAPADLRALTRA